MRAKGLNVKLMRASLEMMGSYSKHHARVFISSFADVMGAGSGRGESSVTGAAGVQRSEWRLGVK